jgi:homopolymeric O-antigen transport system ATP-binding protein
MSQPIITCDRIGKCYKLGAKQQNGLWKGANHTLRDTVSSAIRSGVKILQGRRPEKAPDDHTFWALKDICFEVGRGEVVGIVGRNGAGKSTLLKILSRVVDPTAGTVRLRGRVASLLEVGTGFHPELSGRENIYMNGAILGMRKAEIDRKFDEIVAFAEIDKFLDTPAKRYSSGMYVRLAFAVAAHLEPEILIVDEVLAVGDFAFQKKCLGKMHDVAEGDGRTILFVSHNLSALTQLCEQAILLENGSVKSIGPVKQVVESYLKAGLDHNPAQIRFPNDAHRPFQYISAELLRADGTASSDFSCDESVTIKLQVEIRQPTIGLVLTFSIENFDGTQIVFSDFRDCNKGSDEQLARGLYTFEITIPPRLLATGTYVLNLNAGIEFTNEIEHREACCEFTLRDLSRRLDTVARSCVLGVLLPWNRRYSIPNNTPVAGLTDGSRGSN